MKDILQEKQVVRITELYDRLLKLDSPLAATPMRKLLRGDESVELVSVRDVGLGRPVDVLGPLSVVALTISLSRKIDESVLKRLARWMRTYLPKGIQAITVTEVLQTTGAIQSFLQQPSNRGLRTEISHELKSHNLSDTLRLETNAETKYQNGQTESAQQVKSVLKELQTWNERVYRSLESNLLLNPQFFSEDDISELAHSASARLLGLVDAAKLRLLNLRLDDTDLDSIKPLPHKMLQRQSVPGIKSNVTSLSYGKIQDTLVLIEKRPYPGTSSREKGLLNVKRLAKLLKEAQGLSYHILGFQGFIDEPLRNAFGLVFEVPLKTLDGPVHTSLTELYGTCRYMSLGHRVRIAIAITQALSNLHAVGWVHKSLRSESILFFPEPNPNSTSSKAYTWKFTNPYLLGFDVSRPLAASSDRTKEFRRGRQVYTHPQRWAKSEEKFNNIHDVYSLGVILLELGCWKLASTFDPTEQEFQEVNDERQIQEQLIKAAREQLPHYAGMKYCDLVIRCLSGSFAAGIEKNDPAGLHRELRFSILESLINISASF